MDREEQKATTQDHGPEPDHCHDAPTEDRERAQQQKRAARRQTGGDAPAMAQKLVAAGIHDVNKVTDQVFWALHPELAGQKLEAGSPEAAEWIEIRDRAAKPAVEASMKKDAAKTEVAQPAAAPAAPDHAAAPVEHGAPPAAHAAVPAAGHGAAAGGKQEMDPVKAAEINVAVGVATAMMGTVAAIGLAHQHDAAKTAAGGGGGAAGGAEKAASSAPPGAAQSGADNYRSQDDNTYADDHAKGTAAYTCNMTSLAMSLLSICNGDEQMARERAAAAIRKIGPRPGAMVKLNGKPVDLNAVLSNKSLLAQVQLEDLLTAIGVTHEKGIYSLTNPGVILDVAKSTGLVSGGKAGVTGKLADPKVRERAKEQLAKGEKMILGSNEDHFIYLVDITSAGVIAHDPAGARCSTAAPWFLPPAQCNEWCHAWMNLMKNNKWEEVAQRRLSLNPTALAIVNKLIEIGKMPQADQKHALAEVQKNKATIEMGANNFYSLEDVAHFKLDIRVEMNAAPQDGGGGHEKSA